RSPSCVSVRFRPKLLPPRKRSQQPRSRRRRRRNTSPGEAGCAGHPGPTTARRMEEALLDCALAAARAAAGIHRRYLGRVTLEEWSEKGVADFVTHVDREAEDTIVAEIRRRFPAHAILAEESAGGAAPDRKSTRLNSSHVKISYAV